MVASAVGGSGAGCGTGGYGRIVGGGGSLLEGWGMVGGGTWGVIFGGKVASVGGEYSGLNRGTLGRKSGGSRSAPGDGGGGDANGSSIGCISDGVRPPVTDGVKCTVLGSEDAREATPPPPIPSSEEPTSSLSSSLPSNSPLIQAFLSADCFGPDPDILEGCANWSGVPGVATVLHAPGLIGPSSCGGTSVAV